MIDDDLAIAVGERAVYALELSTGELAWEVPRDGGPLSPPALGAAGDRRVLVYLDGPAQEEDPTTTPTPTATPTRTATPAPTPSDGAASRSEASDLVAIDLGDRSELWRTALQDRSRSGVTIDAERAYVADDQGRIYAVELESGVVAWTADAAGRVESPPAVAGGNVYVVAQAEDQPRVEMLALDVQVGEPAWPRFSTTGYLASAVSAGDGTVLLAVDRDVRAFGAQTGRVQWESLVHGLFWAVSAPTEASGSVLVADESGGLYRLDAADGGRSWEHQTNEQVVRSSPVVAGDSVLLGLASGELAAFDPSTGDLVSTTPATPGYLGAIAVSPDVLVVVKGGGGPGLVAFEHDPEAVLDRRVSPTLPDAGVLVGAFALAAVLVGAVILVPFRLLRGRIAPAFTRDGDRGAAPRSDKEDG